MTELPEREWNDQKLVARMLLGDERAFHAFFDHYFPKVYRFALPRLRRQEEVARDVVQATLVKAVRRLSSFRGEAALFTWLCQICRHEIADYLRAERRRADKVVLFDDYADVRAAVESVEAPESANPAAVLDQAEASQLVRSLLDRLPNSYGDVLEWKYIEGLSVEQIGEQLGIGQIAAQSMLARARTAFRNAVETVFGATADDILAMIVPRG